MLPNWLRNQMTTAAAPWLKDTCTITVETASQDEFGGVNAGSAVVAANVPCRVIRANQPTNTAVAEAASQETLEEKYRLEVPSTIALAVDQSVTYDGKTYRIVSIETELTDRFFRSALMVRR